MTSGSKEHQPNSSEREPEQPMQVSLNWFDIKEQLAERARQSISSLSDEDYAEFQKRGHSFGSLDELYNVGHPNRWPSPFPREIAIDMPHQPLPRDLGEVTLPFSSLLTQVGTHLQQWKAQEGTDYLEKNAKKIGTAYEALAEFTQGQTVSLVLRKGFSETSPFDIKSIR